MLDRLFDSVLSKSEKEFIELYVRHIAKPRIACLFAHGGEEKKDWTYFDGKQRHFVQSWIHNREKIYGCLILLSCNPGSLTPDSKSALLVIPDRVFSGTTICSASFNVVHPTEGDLGYIVDYVLKKLKTQM